MVCAVEYFKILQNLLYRGILKYSISLRNHRCLLILIFFSRVGLKSGVWNRVDAENINGSCPGKYIFSLLNEYERRTGEALQAGFRLQYSIYAGRHVLRGYY